MQWQFFFWKQFITSSLGYFLENNVQTSPCSPTSEGGQISVFGPKICAMSWNVCKMIFRFFSSLNKIFDNWKYRRDWYTSQGQSALTQTGGGGNCGRNIYITDKRIKFCRDVRFGLLIKKKYGLTWNSNPDVCWCHKGAEYIKNLQLFIQEIKLHEIWYTDVKLKINYFPVELFLIFAIVFE